MNKLTIKKKVVLLSILMTMGLISGCGKKENTSVDAGMKAIESQEYESAIASFEKAIVAGEDFELAYRGQGIAYMAMADYENAIKAFEKALKEAGMFPGDLEYDINFYLATAKFKNQDATGAIETLDAII